MSATREQIYLALFNLGSAVTWNGGDTFAYTARRVSLWDDVPGQPAFMQAEQNEVFVQEAGRPAQRTLTAKWIVYHPAGADPNGSPTTTSNQIMDALEAAMRPAPNDPGLYQGRNTLGGLVYRAWIDGNVFRENGDLDGQAMIVVTVKILVP